MYRLHYGGEELALDCRGRRAASIDASGIGTRYDVHLPAVDVAGEVDVSGASVGRDLTVREGEMELLRVDEAVCGRYLDGRDAAFGAVSAVDARVGRDADLRGATVAEDMVLAGSTGRLLRLATDVGGCVDLRGASWTGIHADALGDYRFRVDAGTAVGAVYDYVRDEAGCRKLRPVTDW